MHQHAACPCTHLYAGFMRKLPGASLGIGAIINFALTHFKPAYRAASMRENRAPLLLLFSKSIHLTRQKLCVSSCLWIIQRVYLFWFI